MNDHSIHSTSSALHREDTALVVAESQSFTDFGLWMDAELDRLVARWIHTAAPNASRSVRSARSAPR